MPWLYDGSNFITYDDPKAIAGKAQYIVQKGLVGASAKDNDEYNEPPPSTTQCSDGVKNDGNGFTDLDDPGCENDQDDDESMQRLTISVKKTDDWGAGYCSDVSITNNTADPIDWKVTLKVEGDIRSLWGAIYKKEGDRLTLEGKNWNNLVSAGSTLGSIGFCADRLTSCIHKITALPKGIALQRYERELLTIALFLLSLSPSSLLGVSFFPNIRRASCFFVFRNDLVF